MPWIQTAKNWVETVDSIKSKNASDFFQIASTCWNVGVAAERICMLPEAQEALAAGIFFFTKASDIDPEAGLREMNPTLPEMKTAVSTLIARMS
jgi:hypothetical protein